MTQTKSKLTPRRLKRASRTQHRRSRRLNRGNIAQMRLNARVTRVISTLFHKGLVKACRNVVMMGKPPIVTVKLPVGFDLTVKGATSKRHVWSGASKHAERTLARLRADHPGVKASFGGVKKPNGRYTHITVSLTT